MMKRPPDLIIGDRYLRRWYILPRNRVFNIYVHQYVGSDDDRAMHDHPWWSFSILLKGELLEHDKGGVMLLKAGDIRLRSAKYAHRLELITGTAWTLFITGPKVRDWGFHCPKGWRHWREYTQEAPGLSGIGRGCD